MQTNINISTNNTHMFFKFIMSVVIIMMAWVVMLFIVMTLVYMWTVGLRMILLMVVVSI